MEVKKENKYDFYPWVQPWAGDTECFWTAPIKLLQQAKPCFLLATNSELLFSSFFYKWEKWGSVLSNPNMAIKLVRDWGCFQTRSGSKAVLFPLRWAASLECHHRLTRHTLTLSLRLMPVSLHHLLADIRKGVNSPLARQALGRLLSHLLEHLASGRFGGWELNVPPSRKDTDLPPCRGDKCPPVAFDGAGNIEGGIYRDPCWRRKQIIS